MGWVHGALDTHTTDATGIHFTVNVGPAVPADTTPPVLAPSTSDSTLVVCDSATVRPSASDDESDVESQSCGPVDTSTVGNRTVDCTATNRVGLTTNEAFSYTVESLYPRGCTFLGQPFKAALQPIDRDGSSEFKAKFTVALKFRLIGAAGNPVTDPTVITSLYDIAYSASRRRPRWTSRVDPTSPSRVFRFDAGSLQPAGFGAGIESARATKRASARPWTWHVRADESAGKKRGARQ